MWIGLHSYGYRYRRVNGWGCGMTTREILKKLISAGEDFTADDAVDYTGSSKSMVNLLLNEMVKEGRLKCRSEQVSRHSRINVYSKDKTYLSVKLGGSTRAQMISKQWTPGELVL
jgi:hypothetical protein